MAVDRRRRRGFTLFEILGAVTILAVVYAWLATSAMQGMRSEGLSKRRLEASLRIDEALMTMESELTSGVVPPVGRTEEDLDEVFRLVVDVTPFDPTPFLGEDFPPEGATASLLAAPQQPDEAFLRIVDMRLLWDEAGEEFEVRRTTLVSDPARIAALFPEQGGGLPGELPADGESPSVEDLEQMIRNLQGGGSP